MCQQGGTSGTPGVVKCLGWGLKDGQVLGNCRGGSLPHGGDSVNKDPEEGMFRKDGKTFQT